MDVSKKSRGNILKGIIYILSLLLFIGCTPELQHKILTFFFDGVPDIYINEYITVTDSSTVVHVDKLTSNENTEPKSYTHFPFKERNCEGCHKSGSLGELIEDIPDLCNICHDNISFNYKYNHGPVAAGLCLTCHDPHTSKFSNLQKRDGQQLCYDCHGKTDVLASAFHNNIKEQACSECHNPHGGDSRNFLKGKACNDCHNIQSQYEFKHGPVAAGYCNVCHGSHDMETKSFLIRQGQNLCTYCHTKPTIMNNSSHEGIGNEECTMCHNPHGGEDRFILN